MTRINLIPPKDLYYKFLLSELRELPRVFKHVEKYNISKDINCTYTLNKGHIKFFTNKLNYLFLRYCILHKEAIKRGYRINYTIEDLYFKYKNLLSDRRQIKYNPTITEIKTSQERLNQKMFNILLK